MSNFDFDVRLSAELFQQLHEGLITPAMLLTMGCLYNWADWNTGVVKHVSAGGLHTWTLKAYSERTFSEALRKLEWMGWITRHMKPGSHKSYAVTIHNYKTTDDAGKVHVINPKGITTYEEFPSGRCDEASRETSDEGSDEASDETSDRTSLNTNLKNQSQDKSQDESQNKGLASKLVSSGESLRSSPPSPAGEQELEATPKPKPDRDEAWKRMKNLTCTPVIHDEFEAWNLESEIESLDKVESCMAYWGMDADELRRLIRWAATHKFWKHRIVHVKALASSMHSGLRYPEEGGSGEKGLVPQFRRSVKTHARAIVNKKKHVKEFFYPDGKEAGRAEAERTALDEETIAAGIASAAASGSEELLACAKGFDIEEAE
jgi:hypothetical protein